ncbi:hypothetical protein H6G96_38440 [Nostoc sp. FACHB-892]|nr:hypothetical protein [Nostoc sp. FACHB-892]MBD2731985.1 hypothetical protein [Nostoc sp. FACHB-892]
MRMIAGVTLGRSPSIASYALPTAATIAYTNLRLESTQPPLYTPLELQN